MSKLRIVLLALPFPMAFLMAAPKMARAHHSFAAEFDGNRRIEFTGVLTKIDWTNPHVYLHVDVKDENGRVTSWALETMPPEGLERRGFTRDLLREGEVLTIEGYQAKDETKTLAQLKSVTFPDGKKYILYIYQPDSDG